MREPKEIQSCLTRLVCTYTSRFILRGCTLWQLNSAVYTCPAHKLVSRVLQLLWKFYVFGGLLLQYTPDSFPTRTSPPWSRSCIHFSWSFGILFFPTPPSPHAGSCQINDWHSTPYTTRHMLYKTAIVSSPLFRFLSLTFFCTPIYLCTHQISFSGGRARVRMNYLVPAAVVKFHSARDT